MNLNDLAKEILAVNRANGFGEVGVGDWLETIPPNAPDKYKWRIPGVLALIHSEVSEALEEYRKGHKLDHFGEELADIVIRTLDLAAALEIDIDRAVTAKVEKNRARAYKHGGRLI